MITVVLSIYNRTEYYKEALESLANQTDHDFELLIYANIPVAYQLSKFKDAKLIQFESNERAHWMSSALRIAKYDKITFLDDDDTFEKNKISYLEKIDFGYFHNDYNHLTPGNHIHGNGFNMSCIAINRLYFQGLPNALENNVGLGNMNDTFVYWYALEHHIDTTISKEKLTNYRFRDYSTLRINAIANMKTQIEKLKMFSEYFTSKKVQRIIRQRIIQDSIYLKSYGEQANVSFPDVAWLMVQENVDNRISLLISYFLTMPLLKGHGMNIIQKIRNKKEVKQ